MTQERKDQLFDKMIEWICEHISDSEDLFHTLHNYFGMTKEELNDCGIESLDALVRDEERSVFSALENKGVTLSDFIERLSEMVDGGDKTVVLNWIEFADFIRDCDETGEETLESVLDEVYRPLCYVKNNFDNDTLQKSLKTEMLGNEIIFGAMLYSLGCSEDEVRKFADDGIIIDGYIPQEDDEKESLSLVYVTDDENALYMTRKKDTDPFTYMKKASKIFEERNLNANEMLSESYIGGYVLRRIYNPTFAKAVVNALYNSTAFDSITVYNPSEKNICHYSRDEIPEDFKIEITENESSNEEVSGFSVSM